MILLNRQKLEKDSYLINVSVYKKKYVSFNSWYAWYSFNIPTCHLIFSTWKEILWVPQIRYPPFRIVCIHKLMQVVKVQSKHILWKFIWSMCIFICLWYVLYQPLWHPIFSHLSSDIVIWIWHLTLEQLYNCLYSQLSLKLWKQ